MGKMGINPMVHKCWFSACCSWGGKRDDPEAVSLNFTLHTCSQAEGQWEQPVQGSRDRKMSQTVMHPSGAQEEACDEVVGPQMPN